MPERNRENLARGLAFLSPYPIIRLDGKGNNEETTMETEKKTTRGFSAPCPKCSNTNVQVYLADVDTLHCPDCEEDLALEDIRALVEGWGPVLKWLDMAPALEE
jgi:hypothetical protein